MHESLLLFGATGDLSQRYLFPSLANLLRDRLLPPDFRVHAIARHDYSTEDFRAALAAAMHGKANVDVRAPEIVELLARTSYIAAELADPALMATQLAPLAGRPVMSSSWQRRRACLCPSARDSRPPACSTRPRASCWRSPSGATWPVHAPDHGRHRAMRQRG